MMRPVADCGTEHRTIKLSVDQLIEEHSQAAMAAWRRGQLQQIVIAL